MTAWQFVGTEETYYPESGVLVLPGAVCDFDDGPPTTFDWEPANGAPVPAPSPEPASPEAPVTEAGD